MFLASWQVIAERPFEDDLTVVANRLDLVVGQNVRSRFCQT